MRAAGWLREQGVTVHQRQVSFRDELGSAPVLQRNAGTGYDGDAAAGFFLPLEIARVEEADPFVLFTDVDVMFLRAVDLSDTRPRYLAACGEVASVLDAGPTATAASFIGRPGDQRRRPPRRLLRSGRPRPVRRLPCRPRAGRDLRPVASQRLLCRPLGPARRQLQLALVLGAQPGRAHRPFPRPEADADHGVPRRRSSRAGPDRRHPANPPDALSRGAGALRRSPARLGRGG